MRAFLARHFGAILVGVGINIPSLWRGFVWLTDWLARYDYWATRGPDIPGLGAMLGFITNPPPWMVFVTGILGVAIVLWDVHRPNTLDEIKTILGAQKNRMALFISLSIAFLLLSGGFGFAAY